MAADLMAGHSVPAGEDAGLAAVDSQDRLVAAGFAFPPCSAVVMMLIAAVGELMWAGRLVKWVVVFVRAPRPNPVGTRKQNSCLAVTEREVAAESATEPSALIVAFAAVRMGLAEAPRPFDYLGVAPETLALVVELVAVAAAAAVVVVAAAAAAAVAEPAAVD